MADTTFTDGSSVIYASWLNEINDFYHTLFAASTTAAAARTAIAAAGTGADNTFTGSNTFTSTVTLASEPTAALQAVPLRDLTGYISGLIMSVNGTDPVNDIDISAGVAVDSSSTVMLRLSSSITKRLDAAWAVGTNQGGLDGTESVAGTPDVSTWYFLWLIRKDSDGTIDALFSESASSPTMPAGYTYKRLIGAVYNNSAGDIKAFTAWETAGGGIAVNWTVPTLDVDASNTVTTSETLHTLSVPTGIRTHATVNLYAHDATSTSRVIVYNTDMTSAAPSASAVPLATTWSNTGTDPNTCIYIWTDTSAQVAARSQLATVDTFRMVTLAWEWGRR